MNTDTDTRQQDLSSVVQTIIRHMEAVNLGLETTTPKRFFYGRKVTMMGNDFNMQATCLCQTVPCSAGVQMERDCLMKMVLVQEFVSLVCSGFSSPGSEGYIFRSIEFPPPMILEAYIWWQPRVLNTDGLMILGIFTKKKKI
ncbi:hypothetical protein NC651_031586 [Populus alba x Populus x berolinensis]|nr:hypothetical protein NC651_031586 [Populus alba x Populus x berolinensis]